MIEHFTVNENGVTKYHVRGTFDDAMKLQNMLSHPDIKGVWRIGICLFTPDEPIWLKTELERLKDEFSILRFAID